MKKRLSLILINAMTIILLHDSALATWYPKPVAWTISRNEAQGIEKVVFELGGYKPRFIATEVGTEILIWDETKRCSISFFVTLPGHVKYSRSGNYNCNFKEGDKIHNVIKKIEEEVEKILKK